MSGLRRLIRRSALRPWLLEHGAASSRAIALTFDDGPHPEFTPQVLDVLRRRGAQATFFLVGQQAERHPELVRRMLADGHEIGNHSMTHAEFATLPLRAIDKEVRDAEEVLRTLGVTQPYIWFRPPKGVLNARTLAYAVRRRWRFAMWNRDPKDYAAPSAQAVRECFDRAPLRGGDIVLLHDKTAATVAALDFLLDQAQARSLRCVALSAEALRR